MDRRTQLQMKKQEIEQLIHRKQDNLSQSMAESSDELSLYDQHPADIASDMFEREKDTGLLELLELELEKVKDALSRCETGQDGICEQCGLPIEPQRLQRMVNTTLCAGCAYKQPNHAVEYMDSTIPAGSMGDMGETFQVAGYEMYED